MNRLEERIAAGTRLLDEQICGWLDKIDLAVLDMGSCEKCIIGQLFGDYIIGLQRMGQGLDDQDDAQFGFALSSCEAEDYELLTRAWRAEVRKRVEQLAPL